MTSKPPLKSLPHMLSLNIHHHRLARHHDSSNASSDQQQQPSTCSRWNPTAEQLLALEELYRRGMRTPTAAQIQQIANRLRRFGKIEGKNVFYWFQNHKARERQKRRRLADAHHPQLRDTNSKNDNGDTSRKLENQHDSVLTREGYRVGQTKSRVRPLNCSKSSEIQRNATSEAVELPSSPICSMMSTTTTISVCKTKSQDINLEDYGTVGEDDQTLELFPVKGKSGINASKLQDTKRLSTPNYQYFEFLPVNK